MASEAAATSAAARRRKPVRTPPPLRIVDPNDGTEYMRKEMLGQGSFAECYLVESTTDRRRYAAKVVEKAHLKPKTKDRLYSEIKIHRSLHHPSVIRLDEVFEDANFVYILLEPCPHKTLLEMLRARLHVSEAEVRYWVFHVLDGIDYIHSQSVIHRDLKPGNIMIGLDAEGNVRPKIGDFGLATMLGTPDERKKTVCGTPNYIAPEILYNGELGHSFEVDVWSLGVIMFTLLFGKPPFETTAIRETYKLIRQGKYQYPTSPIVSGIAKEMITWMLQVDPLKRPTVRQLRHHSWLSFEQVPRSVPLISLTGHPGDLRSLGPQAGSKRHALGAIPLYSSQSNVPSESKPAAALKWSERGDAHSISSAQQQQPNVDGGLSVRAAFSSNAGSFVLNWRDFSAKYGMAYELQNGCIGACFNDHSRIVISAARDVVEYSEPVLEADAPSTRTIQFSPAIPPESLNKKMRLLDHFIEFFPRDQSLSSLGFADSQSMASGAIGIHAMSEAAAGSMARDPNVSSVRRWRRGKQGMAFRLSHNLAQMNFVDHTKIYLDLNAQVCFYMDATRAIAQYSIAALNPKTHPSVFKRFRFAKHEFAQF
ncbi:MAG: protein kinase [archaeon]|nr:protein kinase [archaeon]